MCFCDTHTHTLQRLHIDIHRGVIYWSLRHRAAVQWESLVISMTGLYKQQRSNYWDNKSEKESAEKILQKHKAHSGAEDAAALDL